MKRETTIMLVALCVLTACSEDPNMYTSDSYKCRPKQQLTSADLTQLVVAQKEPDSPGRPPVLFNTVAFDEKLEAKPVGDPNATTYGSAL